MKNHSTLTSGQYCNTGELTVNSGDAIPYPSVVNVGTDTTALTGTVADVSVTLKGLSIPTGLGPGYAFLLAAPDTSKSLRSGLHGERGQFQLASLPAANVSFAVDTFATAPVNGALSSTTYEATDYSSSASAFVAATSPAPALPGTINYAQPDSFGPGALNFSSAFGGANGNGDWKLYAYNELGQSILRNRRLVPGVPRSTTERSPPPRSRPPPTRQPLAVR